MCDIFLPEDVGRIFKVTIIIFNTTSFSNLFRDHDSFLVHACSLA